VKKLKSLKVCFDFEAFEVFYSKFREEKPELFHSFTFKLFTFS